MANTSKLLFLLTAFILGLGITQVDASLAGDRRGVRMFAESVDHAAAQTTTAHAEELQKISAEAWAIYNQMLNSNSQAEHTQLKAQMPALRAQLVQYIHNVVKTTAKQAPEKHAPTFTNFANQIGARHNEMPIADRNRQAVLTRESLDLFRQFAPLHKTLHQPSERNSSDPITNDKDTNKKNPTNNNISDEVNNGNDSHEPKVNDFCANIYFNNPNSPAQYVPPVYVDADRTYYPSVSRRIAMVVPRIMEDIADSSKLGRYAVTSSQDIVTQKRNAKVALEVRKWVKNYSKPLFVVDMNFFDSAEAIEELNATIRSIIAAGGQVIALDSSSGVRLLPEDRNKIKVIDETKAIEPFNGTTLATKTMLYFAADYIIVREPSVTFESAMQQNETPVFYTAQDAVNSKEEINAMLIANFDQTTMHVAYFDPKYTPQKPVITFSSSKIDPRDTALFGNFAVNADWSNLNDRLRDAKVTLIARDIISDNLCRPLFIAYASAFTDQRALVQLHEMAKTISTLGGHLVIIGGNSKAFEGIENVKVIANRQSLQRTSSSTNITEETLLRFAANYVIIPIPSTTTKEEIQQSPTPLFSTPEQVLQ